MNSFFNKLLLLSLITTLSNSSNNNFLSQNKYPPVITYSSPYLKDFNNVNPKHFKRFFARLEEDCLKKNCQGYKITLNPTHFEATIEKVPAAPNAQSKKSLYQAHFSFFDLCIFLAHFFTPHTGFDNVCIKSSSDSNSNNIALSLYSNNDFLLERNNFEETPFITYETSSPSDPEFPDTCPLTSVMETLKNIFINHPSNENPRPFILLIEPHYGNNNDHIIIKRVRLKKSFPFKEKGKEFFENAAIFYASSLVTESLNSLQSPQRTIRGLLFHRMSDNTIVVIPNYKAAPPQKKEFKLPALKNVENLNDEYQCYMQGHLDNNDIEMNNKTNKP